MDLLLSGRVFLAEEAAAMGLVNEVVPADQLLDHAVHFASELAINSSPTSMAIIKHQVYADSNRSVVDASSAAEELMKGSLKRSDFKEGVASYLAKRPPEFAPLDAGTVPS